MKLLNTRSFAVVAAAFVAAAPASAEIVGPVLRIQANSSIGSGQWQAQLSAGEFGPDGTYRWTLASPVEMRNGSGELIATLTGGSTLIIEDPVVSLAFSVQAGAADTSFIISSALLGFPTLDPAEGRATGGVSVTDTDGNGATLTGNQPGGTIIRNQYNGLVPAGTDFANLIGGPISAGAFSSNTGNEDSPAVGFTPIGVPISSISLQYAFTLSANDLAAGTATFVVLPAPGAAGLLALAGVAALRRRR